MAGSGKSNSITWAAFQLIEAYAESDATPGNRGLTHPLFDSVIVVTDRRLLDRQIRDNIREFSQVKNIVAPAHSSAELRTALKNGKKIIITTIQKFPFIIDGIADLSDKRFAVIIDEAHSSQSGNAHDSMNNAMGKTTPTRADNDTDGTDAQNLILDAMKARKMRDNASYFAFTATPKPNTLEKFGSKQPDGSFEPFHLYSMKQAIEEKFISILKYVQQQPNYQAHVVDNKDVQNRELALQKMINDAVNQQCKSELELYKLYSQDTAFKQAMQDTIRRMLSI